MDEVSANSAESSGASTDAVEGVEGIKENKATNNISNKKSGQNGIMMMQSNKQTSKKMSSGSCPTPRPRQRHFNKCTVEKRLQKIYPYGGYSPHYRMYVAKYGGNKKNYYAGATKAKDEQRTAVTKKCNHYCHRHENDIIDCCLCRLKQKGCTYDVLANNSYYGTYDKTGDSWEPIYYKLSYGIDQRICTCCYGRIERHQPYRKWHAVSYWNRRRGKSKKSSYSLLTSDDEEDILSRVISSPLENHEYCQPILNDEEAFDESLPSICEEGEMDTTESGKDEKEEETMLLTGGGNAPAVDEDGFASGDMELAILLSLMSSYEPELSFEDKNVWPELSSSSSSPAASILHLPPTTIPNNKENIIAEQRNDCGEDEDESEWDFLSVADRSTNSESIWSWEDNITIVFSKEEEGEDEDDNDEEQQQEKIQSRTFADVLKQKAAHKDISEQRGKDETAQPRMARTTRTTDKSLYKTKNITVDDLEDDDVWGGLRDAYKSGRGGNPKLHFRGNPNHQSYKKFPRFPYRYDLSWDKQGAMLWSGRSKRATKRQCIKMNGLTTLSTY